VEQALRFRVGADLTDAQRSIVGFAGRIGTSLAAAFSVGAAAALAKGFVQAGAEMETFENRLTVMMGSATEARARMGELFEFAAKTPFEVGQIVQAETTLRGFGAAAEELMPGLIDFAATTGADLSQSAIDIGKAWSQGATGLESDWGRVLRKQIELREGTNAAEMALDDFRVALTETLRDGAFAGGAERLSRTFSGMVSNLKDEWGRFQIQVSDAGLFDNVKGVLAETLDLIGQHREEIKSMASVTSTVLWSAFVRVGEAIAVGADGIAAMQLGVNLLVGPVAALGEAIIKATQPLRDAMIVMADHLGLPDAAQSAMWLDARIGDVRKSLGEAKANAMAFVSSFDPNGGALTGFRAFVAEAERTASEFDPESPAGKGRPAGAPGGDGGVGPTDEDLTKRFEAAQEFYARLRASRLDDFEAAKALRDAEMSELGAIWQESLISEERVADAKLIIEQNYHEELVRLTAAQDAIRERAHQDELDRIEREKQARIDTMRATLDAAASIFGTISDLIVGENERAERAQKTWAHASISIDTAVAAQKAFAQYGWPWGLIPMGAVIAQGIAQHVAVERAHQGGSFAIGDMAPDERDITIGGRRRRVLDQERVVVMNSQAARAAEAANASNGAGGAMSVELTVGRVTQREIMRTEQRSGTTIRSMIRALAPDGLTPGWSGAAPVA